MFQVEKRKLDNNNNVKLVWVKIGKKKGKEEKAEKGQEGDS